MGSIQKSGSRGTTWFGFQLNRSSASILFIIALLALLGSLVWLFFIITGIINYASLSAAYDDLTGGLFGYYAGGTLTYYIMYLILDFVLIGLEVYTINKARRVRR